MDANMALANAGTLIIVASRIETARTSLLLSAATGIRRAGSPDER
jgi:hypothetical protein